MAQTEKYLFETSFDAEAPPPAPAEEVPEPALYTEDDLAAARDDGLAKGRTEGRESALQGIEQSAAEALSAIARRLEAAAAELAKVNERRERQSLQAAVTILRKLFPQLARRNGLDEIEAAVAVCLERLRDEPRLVIRTAEDLVEPMCERIDPLAKTCGFEGKLVLLSDPALASTDVRIEWADGGAERDTGRMWQEIDQILADSLGPPAAEADPDHGGKPPEPAERGDDTTAEAMDDDLGPDDEAAAESPAGNPAAEHGGGAEPTVPAPEDSHITETVT